MAHIPDARTAGQMNLALGLSLMLPAGIKGLFVSVVLMGILGGDGMHLHSWSSIFIQDVVLPIRKRPMSAREHLILLRLSVVGVALFAFTFGALFHQTEYVAMWFIVTMAVYIGGAGACIIGGLYWSRGTIGGAWTGLLTGSILSTSGILLRQPASAAIIQSCADRLGIGSQFLTEYAVRHAGANFPFNGTQISFYAAVVAIGSYVLVSLLTCRVPHNMDRLLHRGPYAIESEAALQPAKEFDRTKSRFRISTIVGIDDDFTQSDRWVTLGIFYWSIFWLLVFLVGTAWYLVRPWPAVVWADYWLVVGIYLPLLIGVATTVWFTIGCWNDLRRFFARLRIETVDIRAG